MANYASLQREIERDVTRWIKRLGLSHWLVTHNFLNTSHPDDQETGSITPAACLPQWQYMKAEMNWYLPALSVLERPELQGSVLHEVVHILLAPEQDALSKRATEQMELTTEMVTRALWKAYP